jgi:uncharacterized RDD family membrane protein YckC
VLSAPLHPPLRPFIFAAMTNGLIYCNRCGAQNSSLAKFCSNCGTPFTADAASATATPAGLTPSPQGPAQPSLQPPAVPPAYAAPIPPPMYVPRTGAARFGGFWIRFVAVIIDAIVVGVVTFPVSLIIGVVLGFAGHAVSMPSAGAQLASFLITFTFSTLASWIYEAALESSKYQATLGKMALGLKVTDLEGRRISFLRATGRHFAKILSGFVLCIGFIIAGFTERKQALHDMIAGTLVMRAM